MPLPEHNDKESEDAPVQLLKAHKTEVRLSLLTYNLYNLGVLSRYSFAPGILSTIQCSLLGNVIRFASPHCMLIMFALVQEIA